MKNTLIFDFTVDKSTSTVFVYREFAAPRNLVWDAFTKKEILDQWWAPKPWLSKTKRMSFKVGGRRLYAMLGPEGQVHWSVQDFKSISPISNFEFVSLFTDEHENINHEIPSSEWHLDFSEAEEMTKVNITIKHKNFADLERHIQMGFKQGFTMALNELDLLLDILNKKAL